ncbi:hypothetical protein [Bacillus atrophaeus]|nr:hypothetical protein [Bacillus atrophaeus]MCY8932966.1 hypothetical protein [Bacillus atrophaeus]MCY8940471.1 hypothetical protein [Bacillus atrophaeus]MCY8944970.1 hypothetical protein [Bacillus atrophaeus]
MAEKHITSKYKELAKKHGVSGNTIKSIAAENEKRVRPFKLMHRNY